MEVSDLLDRVFVLKVPVQETDRQEEGLILALEICEHLDHPVDHSRPQSRRNFVFHQAIIRKVRLLELPCVSFNFFAVLYLYVDVLALNLVCFRAAQVKARMLTNKTLSNSLVQRCISTSFACGCKEMRVFDVFLDQV